MTGTTTTGWLPLLEAIRDSTLAPPPAASLVGIELLAVEQGRTTFRYTPRPEHGNPTHVHGGIVAVVADFAITTSVATVADAADVVTADLHVSYMRRVALDAPPLVCAGIVLHLGRSQANAEASLVFPDGSIAAHAVGTCRIRR